MAYENAVDRELDWGDEIKNDGNGYIVLPEGDYPFEVTKFERGRFDGSAKLPPCKMAILSLRLFGDDGEVTITHRLYLHTKCEGLLCSFFTAIGQRKHGEALRMNWNTVVGSKGMAHIEVREWEKNDRSTGQSNQVKYFLDPPEETASVAVPQDNKPAQGRLF